MLGALLALGCSCHHAAPAAQKPALSALDRRVVQYARTLVIPSDASEVLKKSATDAVGTLGRMTGAEFHVASGPEGRGILLLRATSKEAPQDLTRRLDGTGPEAFVLHGADPDHFFIVANTDLGLVAGLYEYLRLLGCRWLLPGEDWTIVPHRADIALDVEKLEKPAFASRTFEGTGGVGRPNASDPKLHIADVWNDWKRRNGFGGSFTLGGHSGEGFNVRHRAVLEAHPEYLALVNGKRSRWSPIAKLCVSNPDAVKLYVDDRVEDLKRHPQFAITVDPADGGGYCQCDRCRAIGSGSVSDQVFYLANQVAKGVAKEVPGGHVSLYAYWEHAGLPTIPIEPNVYVAAVTDGLQRTGLAPDDLLRAWAKVKKPLGVYTYWSLPDWDNDVPTFDWRNTPRERIRFWHALGLSSVSIQTSYAAGPMGLGLYLSSRLLWDPSTDDKALADEFFRLAFEKAASPMRRILERWTEGFMPNYLALTYRDLAEARTLAGANLPVKRRIQDFEEFFHYLRLWADYRNQGAKPGSPERQERARSLLKWLFRIQPDAMVASFRMSQLVINRYEGEPALRDQFNTSDWKASGLQNLSPPTEEEVQALMANGRAAYPMLEFEERHFSSQLVPLPLERRPPALPPTRFRFFGPTDMEFEVPADRPSLEFDVSVTLNAKAPGDDVRVFAPDGHVLHQEIVPPDGAEHRIVVPTAGPGRYHVHVEDTKVLFYFSPPAGVPMAVRSLVSAIASPPVYFFVPKGLRRLAVFAPGAPIALQLFDSDGRSVPVVGPTPSLLQAQIPPGQDGRVWSFRNFKSYSPIRLLNAPQSFSLAPDTVLVPEELAH